MPRSKWSAEVVGLTPSDQFVPPVMAIDKMAHNITCACSMCNDPLRRYFISGGIITADTIHANKNYYTSGPPIRTFHWFRQSAELPPASFQIADGKITSDMLPLDELYEPATWDEHLRYVVLETVLDLEYTIYDTETGTSVQKVPLSFEDAKRECKAWNRVLNDPPPFQPDPDIIKQDEDRVPRSVCYWLLTILVRFIFFYLLFIAVVEVFS